MSTFDVAVIGAGPGGYPAAIRAAQLGKRVALVEKEAFGGTCLNWGCIPTKTMIASAELYHQARHGAALGVDGSGVTFDFARMLARKNEVVKKLSGGVQQLLRGNGVEIFSGAARFEGTRRLSVHREGAEAQWLEANAIIVASGSVSAMPGFLPRHPRVMESRAFLDLTELPRNLIVLGGGVIGCEFACLAAHLGVQVTIVEMLEDILPMVDRDVRRVLRKHLEGLGIKLFTGAPLESIEADDAGVRGKYKDQAIAGDVLLVAIGRKANTESLDLPRAGIAADKRGQIAVDTSCRTSQASIFAIGDIVSGSVQLAHAATSQGIVAAEAAAGLRSRVETVVPACIFTTPEIGTVGMTEEQARQAGREVRTGIFSFAALGKAMAAGVTEGFVKWVADAASDRLLGAAAVGAHATELIAEAAVAVRNEMTAVELGRTIHCHPTMSESWMEAAHALHGTCIHAAPKRR
ncbi:MAG: dihydrolipoyl dehydrogenase [Kiritimatiellae bacterium]|nr:dihydrolipoyl dehydrogenase [Kiritimatiellia bacterium]